MFQYLNEEIYSGERQKLNVFIETHMTEKTDSHISEKRQITCKNISSIRTVLMKGDAGTGEIVTAWSELYGHIQTHS